MFETRFLNWTPDGLGLFKTTFNIIFVDEVEAEEMPPVFVAVLLPSTGSILAHFYLKKRAEEWYDGLQSDDYNFELACGGILPFTSRAALGYASYVIFMEHGFTEETKIAFMVYGANLVINIADPLIFWGTRNLKLAAASSALATITSFAVGELFYRLNMNARMVCLCVPSVFVGTLVSIYKYSLYTKNARE